MAKNAFHLSSWVRLRRKLLRGVIRFVFRVLARVRLTGLENIPRCTAYMAAVNHMSIYDPPFLLAFWPEILQGIGAVDVFDKPFQGELLKMYGVVPVHRGQYDRELLAAVLNMLAAGYPVMIAPEGGRSHAVAMRRAKPGVAYIIDEARVPVVPVGIVGTTDDFLKRGLRGQRPTLELRVGQPFTLPPIEGHGEARRAARQHNADLVMQRIAGLLPPEYRGVYADSAGDPA
jgi:1-acyl-sn-glycerol-3-phosphate acyltransferase